MVDDPTARAMVGYLLVRGGVHIVAYAKALEKLTGVDVGKLLPIPDISNKQFPEAAKHEEQGLHRILYRFSPDDYPQVGRNLERPAPGGRRVSCESRTGRPKASTRRTSTRSRSSPRRSAPTSTLRCSRTSPRDYSPR